jgi:hypothetical protein
VKLRLASVLVAMAAAGALIGPGPAAAIPNCNVPHPPPICNPDGPSPPTHVPNLYLDGAVQTTSRDAIHLWGWAADADAPTRPLTVCVKIDGNPSGAVIADRARPDVAVAFPHYGPAHGFDLVLPASSTGHDVCVTAVSLGGAADANICRPMDDIVQFEANSIAYDTAHAALTGEELEHLDEVDSTNKTTAAQQSEVSGSRVVTDTKGWSDTIGIRVSVSTSVKVGIAVIADGKVTVTAEGSYSFTQNGSTTRSSTCAYRQSVNVPPMSSVKANIAVTHFTIAVPYTLTGDFVYGSGSRVAGTVGGIFTGGNSENLVVNLKQYNLDGTPASTPVWQPPAALLSVTPTE